MPEYVVFVDQGDGTYQKLSAEGRSQEGVAQGYFDSPDTSESDQIEVYARSSGKRFGVTRTINVIGDAPRRRRRRSAEAQEQPVPDAPEIPQADDGGVSHRNEEAAAAEAEAEKEERPEDADPTPQSQASPVADPENTPEAAAASPFRKRGAA